MKSIATVIALTSALFTGSTFAAVESSQVSHFGTGIQFESQSHFNGLEEVVVEDKNLKSSTPTDSVYDMDLYAQ